MKLPLPQKLYPHGLLGAPQVFATGGGGGGAFEATTGAGVAGTGVGVGAGVRLGVGAGVAVDDDSGLEVDGAPPPTPPLPRARLVAFVGVVGVSAAAHAQVETKMMATRPHPAKATTLEVDPNNGSRERIFQPFATSTPTRRIASPKKVRPGLPLMPPMIQKAMKTYPTVATTRFQGLPDRNPGTPHLLSCIRKAAMPHQASAIKNPASLRYAAYARFHSGSMRWRPALAGVRESAAASEGTEEAKRPDGADVYQPREGGRRRRPGRCSSGGL
jgi:hypothetical protein